VNKPTPVPTSYWDSLAGKPVLFEPTATTFMARIKAFNAGITEEEIKSHWWCRKLLLSEQKYSGGAAMVRFHFYDGGVAQTQIYYPNLTMKFSMSMRWEIVDNNRILKSIDNYVSYYNLTRLSSDKKKLLFFGIYSGFSCDDGPVIDSTE
jgi:hypothetical protein